MRINKTANKRAYKSIENANRAFFKGINRAFNIMGKEIDRERRRLILEPPKTGRIYRIRGRTHQASAPGEAPANLTGGLVRSGDHKVSGLFLRGGEKKVNGKDYPKFLEYGTSKMSPRPHVIKAINSKRRDTRLALLEAVDLFIKKSA